MPKSKGKRVNCATLNGSSRIRTCESPFIDLTNLANWRFKPLSHTSTLTGFARHVVLAGILSLIEIKARKRIGKGLAPFLRCDMMVGTQCPPGTFQPVKLNTDNALLCVSAIPHGGVEPPEIKPFAVPSLWLGKGSLINGKASCGSRTHSQPYFKRTLIIHSFVPTILERRFHMTYGLNYC